VIAATRRDLVREVNAGTFRQDLYYRMAVVLLHVPPLRERQGDVPLLIEHFLEHAGFEGRLEDIFTANAMRALQAHHWPGNVRELRNYVEAALAMGEAPHLDHRHRSEPPDRSSTAEVDSARPAAAPLEELSRLSPKALVKLPYGEARGALLEGFESFYLRELLERTRDNVSLAAREAKMNRSHLIRLLKRHEIR
jgi:DNA-binding NtrC family response regulator